MEKQTNDKSSINVVTKSLKKGSTRLYTDLRNSKLCNEEVLLLHYIIETGRFKLMTDWQELKEIENIEAWEDVNELNNILSRNYSKALKRFEMRALTEVSAVTNGGNPKELRLLDNVCEDLLDLPEDIQEKISKVVENNLVKEEEDPLPF